MAIVAYRLYSSVCSFSKNSHAPVSSNVATDGGPSKAESPIPHFPMAMYYALRILTKGCGSPDHSSFTKFSTSRCDTLGCFPFGSVLIRYSPPTAASWGRSDERRRLWRCLLSTPMKGEQRCKQLLCSALMTMNEYTFYLQQYLILLNSMRNCDVALSTKLHLPTLLLWSLFAVISSRYITIRIRCA